MRDSWQKTVRPAVSGDWDFQIDKTTDLKTRLAARAAKATAPSRFFRNKKVANPVVPYVFRLSGPKGRQTASGPRVF